jgi:hypothetical protein
MTLSPSETRVQRYGGEHSAARKSAVLDSTRRPWNGFGSPLNLDRADRTASASYTLVFKGNQTGSGKVAIHLVPVRGHAPLIDAVASSAG